MYREYYGFTHYPFGKDIPSDQLLLYRNFREYKKRMEFLQKHGGIGILWGESGAGKSAGLRWLRDSLNKNRYRLFYLPEPPNSVPDFYRQLALAMDLKPAFRRIDMYCQIQDHIIELAKEKRVLPIIALDECQMYPYQVLESVRLFLNFDMDSKDYAVLILCGQTELKKRLKRTVYEPLTLRVTIQHHFSGLDCEETEKYLLHRLELAGVKHQLFEPDAVQFIHQVTKGNMRKIDHLAVQSLFLGAGLKNNSIDQSVVDTAMQENLWA